MATDPTREQGTDPIGEREAEDVEGLEGEGEAQERALEGDEPELGRTTEPGLGEVAP